MILSSPIYYIFNFLIFKITEFQNKNSKKNIAFHVSNQKRVRIINKEPESIQNQLS